MGLQSETQAGDCAEEFTPFLARSFPTFLAPTASKAQDLGLKDVTKDLPQEMPALGRSQALSWPSVLLPAPEPGLLLTGQLAGREGRREFECKEGTEQVWVFELKERVEQVSRE